MPTESNLFGTGKKVKEGRLEIILFFVLDLHHVNAPRSRLRSLRRRERQKMGNGLGNG